MGNLLYFLCLISYTLPQLEPSSLQPSTVLHHRHLLQTTCYNHLLEKSTLQPTTAYIIYHMMSRHHTILICNNHLEQPIRIHLVKLLVGKPRVHSARHCRRNLFFLVSAKYLGNTEVKNCHPSF